MLRYRYVHSATEASTGYFTCEPYPAPALEEALDMLAASPLDDFLRRHIITRLLTLDGQQTAELLDKALGKHTTEESGAALHALSQELLQLRPDLAGLPFFASSALGTDPAFAASRASSLIFLRWNKLPDRELHRKWGALFRSNLQEHRAFKEPEPQNLPPLYPPFQDTALHTSLPGTSQAFSAPFKVNLAQIRAALDNEPLVATALPLAEETAALAEERLHSLGIIAGKEMRHTASLSPVALLRPWNIRLLVKAGRHDFSLDGQGTTYGRGLSLAQARVSCLMEMVERASCYVSVTEDGVTDRPEPCPLLYGSRQQILERCGAAIDPNDFPLEVPYAQESLYWIQGHGPGAEAAALWVPLQMAALFCNLDEIALMDAPGSTGIAAGSVMEQAKVTALLEIFERDAEATTLFTKANCFKLEADARINPEVAALLANYAAHGINVQFQDLSGPMGVPVYQCFVMGPKGTLARGYGAGLSGAQAALSALTETPFPYPDGGPSGPMLRKLPTRLLHELPDYSLASPAANLALLEELLISNNRPPAYVTMTRRGLDFPVVRALVPGMQLSADSDAFSRVPLRLYMSR